MKSLVLCALVAVMGVVLAAPQNVQDVQLLRYDSENDGLGTYNFIYVQSDGQRRNEDGELRNAGSEDAFVAVKGSYSWNGPDGVTYTVNYIADERLPAYDTKSIGSSFGSSRFTSWLIS